jgi:hypothetical protein
MAFSYQQIPLHRHHQSCILRRSVGRIWFIRAIRLIKSSLKRIHPSRFFRFSECRKWVRITFRHLETSLNRLQQCRFLRRPEGRLREPRPIRQIITSIKRIRPSPGCRKLFRMVFRHLEKLLHWIQQNRFLRRPEGRLWVVRAIPLKHH